MNLKDWEILATINQEGNISKAAKKLFLTQPAVTLRIKKIEKDLSVKILYRTNRGAQLTPQGEYLANQSLGILKQVDNIKSSLQSMNNPLAGTIKIGAANFMMRYKLPEILLQFKRKYPLVNYIVTTGWSSDIFKLMQDEDVHISFVRGNYEWKDSKHLLFDEPLCIASMRKIDIEMLPELPRIDYKTDYKLKELINTWWMENFTDAPKVNMVVARTDICKQMLIDGLGYAILPKLVVRDVPNMYTIDLIDKNSETIVRPSWMLYKKSTTEIPIVNAFVEFIENYTFDHAGES